MVSDQNEIITSTSRLVELLTILSISEIDTSNSWDGDWPWKYSALLFYVGGADWKKRFGLHSNHI